jgi:hypothetical protein
MNRSDMIFGEARENAPARQHVADGTPVFVTIPESARRCAPDEWIMDHADAVKLHHDLGQTLARMMRKRGSATPPDGDIGGTPAAMKVAA